MLLAAIPSPSVNGFYLGPLFVHFYALMYIVGISLAVFVGRRRWAATGGDPELVDDISIWCVPAGIVGGRLYFDITTPKYIPPHWWGPFAVWDGGLGIWGGVALATLVGIWRVRKAGADVPAMMDALAPCLLLAQAIGRIGNYFNQELFGGPTSLPWGLEISPAFRPAGYTQYATFHPTFLYELVWDVFFALVLIQLGKRSRLRPGSLMTLYVAGYSAFRIFEESLRVDASEHFLGLRLNFFVASALTLAGLVWTALRQRGFRPDEQQEAVTDDATETETEAEAKTETKTEAETEAATRIGADAGADPEADGIRGEHEADPAEPQLAD